MKKLTIVFGIIVALVITTNAQGNHFEIELDPLAYALDGASGHIAYTFKNERIQLGYGQLTLPENLQNHDNVIERFKAISLKWDYFFGQNDTRQGFFAGPTFDYLFLEYEEGDSQFKDDQLGLGIRAGYKLDLFRNSNTLKGMYLTPWVGVSTLTKSNDIQLGSQSYTRKAVNFFPTVHLGWSF